MKEFVHFTLAIDDQFCMAGPDTQATLRMLKTGNEFEDKAYVNNYVKSSMLVRHFLKSRGIAAVTIDLHSNHVSIITRDRLAKGRFERLRSS